MYILWISYFETEKHLSDVLIAFSGPKNEEFALFLNLLKTGFTNLYITQGESINTFPPRTCNKRIFCLTLMLIIARGHGFARIVFERISLRRVRIAGTRPSVATERIVYVYLETR
jgi:hypothetical protein